MGESKRRKQAVETFKVEVVRASYRRARILVVREIDDDAEDFRFAVEAQAVSPNAIAPVRFADVSAIPVHGGIDPFADEIDDAVCFDAEAGVLRPLGEDEIDEAEALWHPSLQCVPVGEPFVLSASVASGFLEEDGTPVTDPIARMRGLVRIGAEEVPMAMADAPLLQQFLALKREILFGMAYRTDGGSEEHTEMAGAHLRHLEALHRTAVAAADVGREAWLDNSAFGNAVRDGVLPPDGESYDPSQEMEDGIAVSLLQAKLFPPDRVATRLGARFLAPAFAWMRRDDPGAGVAFEEAERMLAKAGPEGIAASNRAEILYLVAGREPETDARVRAYLDGLERLGAAEGFTLRRDGDLLVGAWRVDDGFNLLVSPPEDGSPRMTDPLMTQGLADVDLAPLDAADPSPDDLGALSFIPDLPDPGTVGNFPTLALMKAHAEGATLRDFCATYALLMRWPAEGEAWDYILDDLEDEEGFVEGTPEGDAGIARLRDENALAADRLALLGGLVQPRLAALIAPLFAEGHRPEAGRDATLLADAVRRKASLPDLALACMLDADAG